MKFPLTANIYVHLCWQLITLVRLSFIQGREKKRNNQICMKKNNNRKYGRIEYFRSRFFSFFLAARDIRESYSLELTKFMQLNIQWQSNAVYAALWSGRETRKLCPCCCLRVSPLLFVLRIVSTNKKGILRNFVKQVSRLVGFYT